MTKENSAAAPSVVEAGPPRLRARVLSWVLRPKPPPLWLGIVVAVGLIVFETLLVFVLKRFAPDNAFGALFMLGVLVVSAGWGFGLAVLTTLASAVVYMVFHLGTDGFIPTEKADWVAIVIFLPVALLANVLVGQARLRTAEAEQRRREAEASHVELRLLADQQAALRRVATLVAQGVKPSEVFSAVTYELARCLGVHHSALVRFEADGAALLIAYYDPSTKQLGERYALAEGGVVARVYLTGRAGRTDSQDMSGLSAIRAEEMGLRSVIGTPIVVDGRVWGAALIGSSREDQLPADSEARMGDFTDLVATAISNTEARTELKASRARIITAANGARRLL